MSSFFMSIGIYLIGESTKNIDIINKLHVTEVS